MEKLVLGFGEGGRRGLNMIKKSGIGSERTRAVETERPEGVLYFLNSSRRSEETFCSSSGTKK